MASGALGHVSTRLEQHDQENSIYLAATKEPRGPGVPRAHSCLSLALPAQPVAWGTARWFFLQGTITNRTQAFPRAAWVMCGSLALSLGVFHSWWWVGRGRASADGGSDMLAGTAELAYAWEAGLG